jgi:hypothetical protein
MRAENRQDPIGGIILSSCWDKSTQRRSGMLKVKTFMSPLKIFHTAEELSSLDDQVNRFIAEEGVKRIISASDACTTDNTGAAIGIIRVVAYEA